MTLSKKPFIVLSTCVIATLAIAILIHFCDSTTVTKWPQHDAAPPSATGAPPTASAGVMRKASAIAPPKVGIDWAKEYSGTSDYFDFVSKAARKALDGDGRAALYISKALYRCSPIARQYAHSVDPATGPRCSKFAIRRIVFVRGQPGYRPTL